MNLTTILGLCGGLGLFLYGMTLMSEGIEKAAGARLRSILEFFTKNKFTGMIVGIVFTGIVQSSSACTVMVVSFVNSGLMNLYQAAGVILGANIGTTVTSQLVSLKISDYAAFILLIGVIMVMFCKKWPVCVKIGEVVLGFGVLFMGLNLMSSSMSGLKESEEIRNLLGSLTTDKWWLAILIGTTITAIVQSSSVTVSILVLMAGQNMIDMRVCLFIILGCNIGACTSALLASLSGKKEAKRAAMIHFLFNVVGTIIMCIVYAFALDQISDFLMKFSNDNPGRYIANAHTIMKVAQVIVLFPFTGLLVKAANFVVPGRDKKINYRDNFQLQFIGDKVIFNPATAVVGVIKEIERMAYLASENLDRSMNCLVTLDQEDMDEVMEVEKNIDWLNHAITDYLVKINQSTLPLEDKRILGALFHVVNDIERIGDHAENFAEEARQRKESGVEFSKDAQAELGQMLDLVDKNLHYAISIFAEGKEEHIEDVVRLENEIDAMEKKLQQAHIDRLTRQECTPEAGMIFSDIVSGLERIGDHATNIAFSVVTPPHEESKESF